MREPTAGIPAVPVCIKVIPLFSPTATDKIGSIFGGRGILIISISYGGKGGIGLRLGARGGSALRGFEEGGDEILGVLGDAIKAQFKVKVRASRCSC